MAMNYKNFYRLLKILTATSGLAAEDLKKQLVGEFTNKRTDDIKAMKMMEYSAMIGAMEAEASQNADVQDVQGDLWRKRVIAAFCEYYDLMGYYKDACFAERMHKAKGEACKAKGGGGVKFNDIPVCELQALYYGKCKQNRILRGTNKQFGEDLKKNV